LIVTFFYPRQVQLLPSNRQELLQNEAQTYRRLSAIKL
jgi:hypothetical protein